MTVEEAWSNLMYIYCAHTNKGKGHDIGNNQPSIKKQEE